MRKNRLTSPIVQMQREFPEEHVLHSGVIIGVSRPSKSEGDSESVECAWQEVLYGICVDLGLRLGWGLILWMGGALAGDVCGFGMDHARVGSYVVREGGESDGHDGLVCLDDSEWIGMR